ncbi:MAG: SpoIID/LytB domain-containing protein [Candidatus Babeliales bacterium]
MFVITLFVNAFGASTRDYESGVSLIYRAAVIRANYQKLPYRKRPRWQAYYLAALYPLGAHVHARLAQDTNNADQFTYQVRVLLHEIDQKEAGSWKLSSPQGVIVKNFKVGEWAQFPHMVTVEYRNGALFINKHKSASEQIWIEPVSGFLHLNGNDYAGTMLFVKDKKKGYCISQLDIEAYIGSVLRCESWPGWPIEVNKAFAIACRSYLVSKIAVATQRGLPFHIKNTNIHQTYNGVHTSAELLQAVNETKGIILAHNKKPIEAMFDSCCGGVIPAHIEGVDFAKAPYLARTSLCTYCKPCKIYNWHAEYPLSDVAHRMRKAGIKVNAVDSMEITKLDKAGLVKEVIVKDGKKRYKLNGKQCYALFDKVNSFCYSIKKENKSLVLAGRGYGHHLGICQWGARRMLDHGKTYRDILEFYYPGVEFMKLTSA